MSRQAVIQEINLPSTQVAYMQLATGYWVSQALYVAARLGIAGHLQEAPRTSEELAASTGAHAPSLYRVLRMLASCGVFAEDSEKRFSMTPLAQMMLDGPGGMRAMTLHLGEKPSWQAWGALLESVETGETAFARANGMEVFPYYAAHPESNEPFNQAMTDYSGAVTASVMEAYDFSAYRNVVDIGGGHGSMLAAILKANPEAEGTLFDLEAATEGARRKLEAEGLLERCDVIGGDFFKAVPAGGDAYVLKHIIHDWDEERALAILSNVRVAMAEGARLLLIETVIPEGNEPSFSKFSDVHMMVMTGGQERTEREYAVLLRKAGFQLKRVVQTASLVSIVEAVKA